MSRKYAQLYEILSSNELEKPSKCLNFMLFFQEKPSKFQEKPNNLVSFNLLGFSRLTSIFFAYMIVLLS